MKTRDLTGFFSLAGRTALVTGGGSGLGLAVAEGFAQFGARVSVVDVDEAAAADVAEGINAAGGHAIAVRCDVADHDQVEAAVAATVEQLGDIHILFSNAGIGERAAAEEMTPEQPHAGGLFVIEPGVIGLPITPFAGWTDQRENPS